MFCYRSFVASVFFIVLCFVQQGRAQLKNWDGPNFGDWNGPFNWTPAGAPGPADTVFIGVIAGTQNSNVNLADLEQIQNLEIRNGSDLYLFDPSSHLIVTGTTTVGGDFNGGSSSLHVSGDSGLHFQTGDLVVESGGLFANYDMGDVNVSNQFEIEPGGQAWINGDFHFTDDVGRAMNNNGVLRTNMYQLSLWQQGNARLDLDGTTGNGVIRMMDVTGSANLYSMFVNGTELFDDFSGTIEMVTGSSLTMVFDTEWVADANSMIHIESLESDSGQLARIGGTAFRLDGTMLITDGFGNIGEPVEMDADWAVGEGALVELEQNTFLNVFDETSIEGATFITASGSSVDGLIDLSGPTSWQGVNNIFGSFEQSGDATVDTPAVINAETIDLDGDDGSTRWNVNSALTINASAIDKNDNVFDGCFYLDSSISTLSINIDSGETWFMDGEIIMANSFPFPVTKLSGTPVEFGDHVFVESEGIRIEANSTFNPNSYIEFDNPDSSLILDARSSIHQDADFDGDGTLINGTNGDMNFGNGFFQNQISVINEGTMNIADGAGLAVFSGFANASSGFFQFEIGGPAAGADFDFLIVSDEIALLSGRIRIKLIDGFKPSVGDEFTVLTAPNGIVGQFTNAPVSIVGNNGFVWEVLHNPFDVTVRLDSVVPNVLIGDVNQDGIVDLLDVVPFTDAITISEYEIRADMNCDGVVDLLDVDLFVQVLAAA